MKHSELNWDQSPQFMYRVIVDNSAIDSYAHVNNSVYLRWLDECARAHSFELGIDCDQAVEFGFGMAVRESRVSYLAAGFENETLIVGTSIVQNDLKLRIVREFQIIRPSDGATLIRAEIDYVCINIKTGRPSKMPNEFKELYVCCDK